MHYKKRIFIIVLLITGLLAYFWLGSRYPAIDEKAVMAGSFMLEDVLSFEATFEVSAEYPAWKRIGLSTLNWIMTNRQGMTFGVLLAALVLTLLQAWPLKQRPGRTFTDILKGVLIGAPLGVCVNCAAPIAYGMQKEGVHKGTSLATMFASPTLNIIVLTMMFSLLPFYMATTRVVVTFLFLLLVLPLLLRLARRNADKPVAEPDSPAIDCAVPAVEESWFGALFGTAKDFIRNLLFIVVRTVPLMLLAGFLGTAMATVLPLESVTVWQVSLIGMVAVALLGTFAPVPIAFDIVAVQALLVIGVAPEYAMVLLVTLGMFSIYPLLLVSKMTTWRFSLAVFATVALLGVCAGYFAGGYQSFMLQQNQEIFESRFGLQSETPDQMTSTASPVDGGELETDRTGYTQEMRRGSVGASVKVDSTPHLPRSTAGSLPFSKANGRSMGLVSSSQQVLDLMMPFSQGRGIASGDIDRDGWPDLAVAQNRGITLYRNIEGNSFEDVTPDIPNLQNISVLLVAFVDMDNDGCLDLFAGGFGDADHFLVNDCEGFKDSELIPVSHETAFMTQAAAFADHDRDGDLDLLKGNWFFLFPRTLPSPRNANYLALNRGDFRFQQNRLEEIDGATLAVLMTDFNNDGFTDKLIGNDFMEPDFYYRGDGNGSFVQLKSGGVIPTTTLATMSFDTADIDNDLDFDIYQSGKVNDFSLVQKRDDPINPGLKEMRRISLQKRKDFQQQYCSVFENTQDHDRCLAEMANHDRMRGTRLAPCLKLPTKVEQDECIVTIRLKNSIARRDFLFCRDIPPAEFPVHKQMCDSLGQFDDASSPNENIGYQYLDQGVLPQKDQGNVLLVQGENGQFEDRAEEYGVFDGRWAWSAKFADLNNDEWQDLFLVNGWWLETTMYSNQFFLNRQGKGFESKESDFGLQSILKQHAFTYLDLDLDGDLDIITRSLAGDMQVWRNNLQDQQSITFEFRDQVGNVFGIGNKITIHYGDNEERHQVRELKAGGGFVSFDEPRVHFGLGSHGHVSRVVIDWADGGRTELPRPLTTGHHHIISRTLENGGSVSE